MLSRSNLHEYRIFNGITAFACHYSNCIILIGNFAILVKIVIMKTIQTMSHSHTLIDAIVWLSRAFHIYTVRTPKHVPLKCCRCHSAIQIRAYFRHVQYMNDEYVNRREHIHVISAAFHCQITIKKNENHPYRIPEKTTTKKVMLWCECRRLLHTYIWQTNARTNWNIMCIRIAINRTYRSYATDTQWKDEVKPANNSTTAKWCIFGHMGLICKV